MNYCYHSTGFLLPHLSKGATPTSSAHTTLNFSLRAIKKKTVGKGFFRTLAVWATAGTWFTYWLLKTQLRFTCLVLTCCTRLVAIATMLSLRHILGSSSSVTPKSCRIDLTHATSSAELQIFYILLWLRTRYNLLFLRAPSNRIGHKAHIIPKGRPSVIHRTSPINIGEGSY